MSEEREGPKRTRTNEFDFSHRVSKESDGITGIVEPFLESHANTDSQNVVIRALQESLMMLDPEERDIIVEDLINFVEDMDGSGLLAEYPEANPDRVRETLGRVINSLQGEG
jgi:hypothetical protein